MRVIQPKNIVIASTSVAANSETEWSASTTYAHAAKVQVTTATPHRVYESLRGNNTNKPPASWLVPQVETATSTTSTIISTGSKTITVETGKGFTPGMIVKIAKTVTPYSFNMTGEVSEYISGSGSLTVIVYSVSGEGTHAAWTITSEDEVGFWKEVETTNQWKMFDEYVNTATESADDIDILLEVGGVDHVAMFGIAGSAVEMELWNADQTTLFWSTTIDMIYGASILSTIGNWYDYFFGTYSVATDLNQRIPVLVEKAKLAIKIVAFPGGAACGGCITGRSYEIGSTLYGASVGMVDFSYRDEDESGRVKITQGYWAKRNSLPLSIENIHLDTVYKILTSLRGVPTAWIGNNGDTGFEAFVVYGIFKDFTIVVPSPTRSTCDLEIEGLI